MSHVDFFVNLINGLFEIVLELLAIGLDFGFGLQNFFLANLNILRNGGDLNEVKLLQARRIGEIDQLH